MDEIVEQTINDEEIAKLAKAHNKAKESGSSDAEILARFQYAYALIRSSHSQDTQRGISLLENLYYDGQQSARRDYLYYIAIGHTRLKNYKLALDCIDQFLQFEPNNHQAKQLRAYIKERLLKDGIFGMAVTGGAALVVGGLIGLAISLAKK